MAVAGLNALFVKACLALGIISLASTASAQTASTTPQEPTELFTNKMALVIETNGVPFKSPYDIIPLTSEANLQPNVPDVNGDLIMIDHSNFTKVDYAGTVVFLSCDSSTAGNDSNLITPNRMLNTIMGSSATPTAILLYSTAKPICYLGGSDLPYKRLWTMTSPAAAIEVRGALAETGAARVAASIHPNIKAVETPPPRAGSTSAIAMSILYSITGLITLLFLFIIGTGAVRAHRNPERYGPRAGVNGRPRRSRARGLAMAMLETLPIVKFGESDERKPDEENALENAPRAGSQPQNAESQPQDVSQATADGTPNNNAVPESSSDVANNATSQREGESTNPPTGSTPHKAKDPKPEEDHLGCSICTEDFTVGEDVRVLPCNHKFHPACVDPWLVNVSGTCPLCRLDLRPPEEIEQEGNNETTSSQGATMAPADGHLAPPAEADQAAAGEATQRRRRSRLLDWNRLRHASVDERLQALRQYRQAQQGPDPASNAAEDERRHSRLADRLRERFHIRGDSRSSAAAPESSLPPASTVQH